MLRRFLVMIALIPAVVLAGCSESSAPPAPKVAVDGPHGGAVVSLPGNAGFAEIFSEVPGASDTEKAARGRVAKAVVVYFLGPDKTSALSSLPTAVTVTITGASGGPIELTPTPDAKDPAGAGKFASKPGEYDLGGRRAELNLDLGGNKVTQEFTGLR